MRGLRLLRILGGPDGRGSAGAIPAPAWEGGMETNPMNRPHCHL